MRDDDFGADVVPIATGARSKLSIRVGALLRGLPLSEAQKRKLRARARDIDRVATKVEEMNVGSDPALVKSLADAFTHHDDNVLTYRMRKQADTTEAALHKDAFDVHHYDQELKVLWMVLAGVLSALFVGLGFSMWLIVSGREAIGNPILSAIVSGALSYLAGLGTPRGLLRRGGPGSERGG